MTRTPHPPARWAAAAERFLRLAGRTRLRAADPAGVAALAAGLGVPALAEQVLRALRKQPGHLVRRTLVNHRASGACGALGTAAVFYLPEVACRKGFVRPDDPRLAHVPVRLVRRKGAWVSRCRRYRIARRGGRFVVSARPPGGGRRRRWPTAYTTLPAARTGCNAHSKNGYRGRPAGRPRRAG